MAKKRKSNPLITVNPNPNYIPPGCEAIWYSYYCAHTLDNYITIIYEMGEPLFLRIKQTQAFADLRRFCNYKDFGLMTKLNRNIRSYFSMKICIPIEQFIEFDISKPYREFLNCLVRYVNNDESTVSEPEKPKYYSGKIVCVKSDTSEFTLGKVYEVKDGIFRSNLRERSNWQSLTEINNFFSSKFAELIE